MSQAGIVDFIGTHPELPILFICNVGSAVPIANTLEILGEAVAAHSVPIETVGSGNTVLIELQYASAAASSVANNAGAASFNSANFTVDANGYVTLSGSGFGETITGDTGGPLTPTAGNWNIITNVASNHSGASFLFSGSGSTLTLNVTDVNTNTYVGASAGTSASASSNCGFGAQALSSITTGASNTAVGATALTLGTNLGSNVAIGTASLGRVLTGQFNSCLGTSSGHGYTGSESSNICISNLGTLGDNNTTRIGTQGTGSGQQNQCFIAGIVGVTTSNSNFVTINTSTGQLGVTASAGGVTIDGDTGSATGSTITFTALNGADNSGSSVNFAASGSTVVLNVTDSNSNTIVGLNAGNSSISGTDNTAFGTLAFNGAGAATNSTAIGFQALNGFGGNDGATAVGSNALRAMFGQRNTAMGSLALGSTSGGSGAYNTSIGWSSLASLTSGAENTVIGCDSTNGGGSQYTSSETQNILIANAGVTGDSATIRIGNVSTQTSCYVAGIKGVTVANPQTVVINSSTGQMGVSSVSFGDTLTGDSGGAISPSGGNWNIKANPTSGSSVSFSGSGSTLTLNTTDSASNVIIGNSAGNSSISAARCTGLGFNALHSLTAGNDSCAFGTGALTAVTSGQENCGFGRNTLLNTTTGQSNLAFGNLSGSSLSATDSSNILINHVGVSGDANTIRIGTQGSGVGQQALCFIAGIAGSSAGTSNLVTINTSTGQLGSSATTSIIPTGASGTVLQGQGTGVLPAYSTATYPSTATSTGTILRANGTNWAATTATYPSTTTANQLLYSSATNTIGGLTSGNSLLAATNSSGTLAMRAFSVHRQVFTSTGTYTPSTGMLYCDIICIGGGAAGGGAPATTGSQFSGGGGGGAGEYAQGIFSASTIGASQSITIGTGGTGNSGATGGNGGSTSVGSLISSNGGSGGVSAAATTAISISGGAGGTGGTGGDFRTPGNIGGPGWGSVAGGSGNGGIGGNGQYGSGGQFFVNAVGGAGAGYGSGGGGSFNGASQSARAGGTGASGIVLVTEYIIN
jgi:hypothetical protein